MARLNGLHNPFTHAQLQRGLQIYTEVCAACHGLEYVALRTLADDSGPHLPEDQMKQYVADFPINDEAANMHLYDAENDELRPLAPTDNFPAVESLGAPVDPGNLLMLAYHGSTPIVGAPGCSRSPKDNIIDLVLPRLLAGDRLTRDDIIAFAIGGLLEDVPERPLPRSRLT